jgi:hypothetical protein
MPQYTNSAIEQELKKPERLPVGWPWRLLVFVIIIFGITVAVYLGMAMGYKPYLNSRIKNLDDRITNLTQSVDENQQKNLVVLYSQLVNIQGLLDSHPAASKFFDFLDKNTHQQITYINLDLSSGVKIVQLEGTAPSYGVLSQQLELFRQAPEIEKVFLDDSRTMDTGAVRFSARLIFKPELIK